MTTFKKVSSLVTVATIAVGFVLGFNGADNAQVVKEVSAPVEQVEKAVEPAVEFVNDNVGNGEEYAYEVTDVDWTTDEIHGVPLNKESEGNKGIFLYAQEVPFDVEVGDRIIVVWGEEEDEFASIERAYQTEDGSWVGESFYK